jgi:transposase
MTIKSPSNPRLWAGIDLAKATFQLALWGHEDLRSMRTASFPRNRLGCRKAVAWLRKENPEGRPIGIVMEATGAFAETTAGWLLALDPSLHISIMNPIQTSAFLRSLGLRNKTDDLDARALALYGAQRNPGAWIPLPPEIQVLREMTRTRTDLLSARTSMMLRLKDHKRVTKLVPQAMRAVIRTLDAQVEALDEGIKEHLETHEALEDQVRIMVSIKGVGLVTAVTVLSETGDLRRYPRSRQLTAFAGVTPRQNLSGTSVRGRSPMCKRGNGRIRAALYMSAVCAIRYNPDMTEVYERMVAKGKHKRVALGAVMRKLLVLMRALVVRDQTWKPRAVSA